MPTIDPNRALRKIFQPLSNLIVKVVSNRLAEGNSG